MQLLPRYLVKNNITIIANDAGFATENRPVYQRNIKIYKGIDNTLTFRMLNADSKPIDVSNYTPKFIAYDENKRLVIEHDGVLVPGDDSAASRGLFNVTITENDMLNLESQYLNYTVYLNNNTNGNKTLTYTHNDLNGCGTLYLDDCQFPGPAPTHSLSSFTETQIGSSIFVTESLTAEPAINGNEALHTAVFYTDSFVGDVIVEGTLDNQITSDTAWAEIDTITFDGTEDEPKPLNFNSVISYLRFKTTANPANKITKILIRN